MAQGLSPEAADVWHDCVTGRYRTAATTIANFDLMLSELLFDRPRDEIPCEIQTKLAVLLKAYAKRLDP
jgi:hypothetical protein